MSEPKILIYDIETGGVNALRSDLGMILNFGYKWFGEKKKPRVLTVDQFPNWFTTKHGINDRGILKAALKIMEEADILVAHYGDRFDRRFLQGRCVIHGFDPPPPTKQRDTWRIARTAFNFSSNRLDNIAMVLGLKDRKMPKDRSMWPGWWHRALAGDHKAIREMAKYCAQDVVVLEQIYKRIRLYDNPHPRVIMDRAVCGLCGGKVHYKGFTYVGQNKYRKYVCTECGRWDRSRTAEKRENQ